MANKKIPDLTREEYEKLLQQLTRDPNAPNYADRGDGFIPWNVSRKKASVKRTFASSLPEEQE